MKEISKLAELRKLMFEMEKSMGLQGLSAAERDIYYAASDLSGPASEVKTTCLQAHALVAEISRPTFFRALKSLVKKGYLTQPKRTGRGSYFVTKPQ